MQPVILMIEHVMLFTAIVGKLRRAARNDERVHLDVGQVRAITRFPLHPILMQLGADGLGGARHEEGSRLKPDRDSLAARPRSASEKLSEEAARLIQDADSKRAFEATTEAIRQSRRRKRRRGKSGGAY
jgi:hypothetical protein